MDCLTWAAAYPGVNVLTELIKARAWLDANACYKKTANRMKRFLVNWMSRAQNQGRPNGGKQCSSQSWASPHKRGLWLARLQTAHIPRRT